MEPKAERHHLQCWLLLNKSLSYLPPKQTAQDFQSTGDGGIQNVAQSGYFPIEHHSMVCFPPSGQFESIFDQQSVCTTATTERGPAAGEVAGLG